ncbi:hypothetical protein JHW43_002748 [Diplocarpon mali]|nr:hypothetical protein JHW43_002748 [Diplocarpon mali]
MQFQVQSQTMLLRESSALQQSPLPREQLPDMLRNEAFTGRSRRAGDTRNRFRQWADAGLDVHEETANESWIKERPAGKRRGAAVWGGFSLTPQGAKVSTCPCGEVREGESFESHFRERHMLREPSEKRRLGEESVVKEEKTSSKKRKGRPLQNSRTN